TRRQNHRRICNTYLFTTQKIDSNQDIRRNKIQELLEGVRQNAREGKVVDIGRVAFRTSCSVLLRTAMSLDVEEAKEFQEATKVIAEYSSKPNLGDYFPVLGMMDLQGIQRRMRNHYWKVLNLFGRIIDERLKKRKSEEYVSNNDMLDTLLDINERNGEVSMDLHLIKYLFLVSFFT
ncbi:Geraniol 8-hydroxylase, partial [Linum perenne]